MDLSRRPKAADISKYLLFTFYRPVDKCKYCCCGCICAMLRAKAMLIIIKIWSLKKPIAWWGRPSYGHNPLRGTCYIIYTLVTRRGTLHTPLRIQDVFHGECNFEMRSHQDLGRWTISEDLMNIYVITAQLLVNLLMLLFIFSHFHQHSTLLSLQIVQSLLKNFVIALILQQ